MRFNPLWLIVLLFLLPGAGLLLLPLLLFAALPLLFGLAGGGTFLRAPGQIWTLLKSPRARANLVLAHAACRVLGERYGVAPLCWCGENGFFLTGGRTGARAAERRRGRPEDLLRLPRFPRPLRRRDGGRTRRSVAGARAAWRRSGRRGRIFRRSLRLAVAAKVPARRGRRDDAFRAQRAGRDAHCLILGRASEHGRERRRSRHVRAGRDRGGDRR